jgi:division protein CdvB (Snf7/Vps24/ESCRT-III family)
MTLTSEQLLFLARFSKSPEGKALVSMYEAELAEADGKLRKATGEDVYRLQGRASQIEEMIDRIKTADSKANSKRPAPSVPRPFGA